MLSLKSFKNLIKKPALLFIYLLIKLLPRKKDIYLFSSRDCASFSGNSKYLFLYFSRYFDGEVIYIIDDTSTRSEMTEQGYNAFRSDSLHGIYYCIRAKYIFQTTGLDVPWWTTGGATIIQLWHSVAIKKFGWDNQFRKDNKISKRIYYDYINKWDFLTVTSKTEREKMSSAYQMNSENVWITGYPRNDVLFSNVDGSLIGVNEKLFNTVKDLYDCNTIFGYFPTWRENKPEAKGPVSDAFDPEVINAVLNESDYYMVVKFHPKVSEEMKLNNYDRIIQLPSNIDVMPFLKHVDVIITDYSSIFVDYLLLDRDVIFYPYDIKDYTNSRQFYHDYDQITPGPIATNMSELLTEIRRHGDQDEEFDRYSLERERVRNIFFDYKDGNSSKRIKEKMTRLR